MLIATGVCEACAGRGRPNQPVYKIGLCEFCYHGLPHPSATLQQLATERIGAQERSSARILFKRAPTPRTARRLRSDQTLCGIHENPVLLRAELAERELALTNRRAELAAFEGQYLRQVGILYAELDDWNAKIAERLAEAEGTEDAWCVAALARVRAEESSNAAHSEEIGIQH